MTSSQISAACEPMTTKRGHAQCEYAIHLLLPKSITSEYRANHSVLEMGSGCIAHLVPVWIQSSLGIPQTRGWELDTNPEIK